MRVTPVLVFDIETIPDAEGLRKLWELDAGVSDDAVVDLAQQRRRQATGNDFLPAHLQRVVAISCALRSDDGVRVWSLGSPEDGEREIVQRFFDGIEKYTPQLVSWNGSGFDLPVLHYRALVHGIPGCCYWDHGENDREFKFNNYLSRFHSRHTDLMDVLAGYQNRAWAPLDEIAQLCGLPGKLGMDGSQVYARVEARRDRGDPQLLRDRRRQHLPALPALPADPRHRQSRRLREGGRTVPRLPRGAGSAALEAIRRRVEIMGPGTTFRR